MFSTVSEVWLKLYGAVYHQQDSPQSMQERGGGGPTHGGNYGIMLYQECSHVVQWDLMEVPVAA